MDKNLKTNETKVSIIEIALNSKLSPLELIECLETNHIKNGYKNNEGRGRCIRKDGTFDYLKMSELYHSKNW